MKLFDYQKEFENNTRKSFRKHRKVIGVMPTGAGKGVVLASIAMQAIAKGKVPCIACHREEIFNQLYKNLRSFGIQPSIIASGQYPMGGAPCYLCMVETFCRRMSKGMIDHFNIDFFILDEVHFGSYYKMVNNINDAFVFGLTATPKSTGSPELNEYFDDIVIGPSIKELQDLGRLCKAKTFSIKHDFSKVKKKGKEYDDSALFKEFKKPKLWHGAVDSYMENAKGLKALCYSVNVEHSNATMLQFRERGIKAAHVDGNTDKDTRRELFNMYTSGEIDVLCNVGIATTGTDIPDTKCIIQNFATTSIVKHIQTAGRGARAHESKNGEFVIIDMGRNYLRHGEFGEDIDWLSIYNEPSKAFEEKPKRKKRECDECGMVIKLTLQKCPYCGDFISQKQVEDILLFGASTEEIREYKLKHLPVNLRKPVSQMSHFELTMYAKHMGYKPSWVFTIKSKMKK
jgi:superfamily II DNA or RNA helicase